MSRTVTPNIPYTELEVATGNYDTSRSPIDRIVIHTMDGTWQGAAARFDNPASHVSAHYGVKLDGGLVHWLEETSTAYHAGNYMMNQRSIGIEHEDGGNYNDNRPAGLYDTSSRLVADICLYYSIPCDRTHILKHNEVSDAPTGCPDALDIDRIIQGAQALIANASPQQGTPPDQEVIDQLRLDRDKNWNLYQDQIKQTQKKDVTIQELQHQLLTQTQSLQDLNTAHQKQLDDLINENTGLKTQIKQVNDSNASIAGLYQAKCKEDATAIDNASVVADAHKNLLQDFQSLASALKTAPRLTHMLQAIDHLLGNQKPKPTPIQQVQQRVTQTQAYTAQKTQSVLSLFGVKGGE